MYNEEDTINHHGFQRSVTESSNIEGKAEKTKNIFPHRIAKMFGTNYSVFTDVNTFDTFPFLEKYIIPIGSIIFAIIYWSVAVCCYLGFI